MLGSGALFFSIRPKVAILGDINPELINFFHVLRSQPSALITRVSAMKPTKAHYYLARASRPPSRLARAARFCFLIRLAWNGLYRVNLGGQFNVPFGGRKPKSLLNPTIALEASRILRSASLVCGDFEASTASAKTGDFVYFDPPYPKGAVDGNGFARYHETRFTIEDHRRLACHASALADRGVNVLITEAARKEVLGFYSSSFRTRLVRTRSLIAADSRRRGSVYEAVLTSYET